MNNFTKLVTASVEPIEYNGVDYYLADDVVKYAPVYFRRIKKNMRDIVNNGFVKQGEYIFIRYDKKNDEYNVKQASDKCAKLYLSEIFLKSISELSESGAPIVDTDGVEQAPELLYIDDKDKFKDEQGRPLNIEVRGVRHNKGCYFRLSDVSKEFKLPNIQDHILDKRTTYEEGKHYKYFVFQNPGNPRISENENKTMQKALFLTWRGVTNVLYTSHNGIANRFQDWADDILFVAHMGDDFQRKTLASSIEFNVNTKDALNIPGLYLIKIADVVNVRDKMEITPAIPNDACVYKFGRAEEIQSRFEEHVVDPEYIALGQSLGLSYAVHVPKWDLVQAEKDLRALVYPRFGQTYNNKLELITLTKDELVEVKGMYESVSAKYTAILSERSTYLKDLEHKVEILEHENNALTKMNALQEKLIHALENKQ